MDVYAPLVLGYISLSLINFKKQNSCDNMMIKSTQLLNITSIVKNSDRWKTFSYDTKSKCWIRKMIHDNKTNLFVDNDPQLWAINSKHFYTEKLLVETELHDMYSTCESLL